MLDTFFKKKYTSAFILVVLIGIFWYKFRDTRPPAVAPCPGYLQSVEVQAFHFGRFESHQALKVSYEGSSRSLDCVGLKQCPAIGKKTATLLLKADECTLKNKPHSISVYEIQLIEKDSRTTIFPKPSSAHR